MKKSVFRHVALAGLIIAVGLLVSSPSRADLFSMPNPDFHFPDLSGLLPTPHADLTGCTIKAVSMDAGATDFNLKLVVDCDGSKNVTLTGTNMDRLKIIYTEALAAFLSDGKITLTNVGKYAEGENYQAGTINITK